MCVFICFIGSWAEVVHIPPWIRTENPEIRLLTSLGTSSWLPILKRCSFGSLGHLPRPMTLVPGLRAGYASHPQQVWCRQCAGHQGRPAKIRRWELVLWVGIARFEEAKRPKMIQRRFKIPNSPTDLKYSKMIQTPWLAHTHTYIYTYVHIHYIYIY